MAQKKVKKVLKKSEQQKSTVKKPLKVETVKRAKSDWRDQIVRDIEKALKVSQVKNPKTDKIAICYPEGLLKVKKNDEAVHDKILLEMMKERWNGLYGFSIAKTRRFEITRRNNGGFRTEYIGIEEVRKTKKQCKTAVDLMKADMESCATSDKALEKAGIKKLTRDIYKDDCCFGCKFALENMDEKIGPFDRRFVCFGITRILEQIIAAEQLIKENTNCLPEYSSSSMKYALKEKISRSFLSAQDHLLAAAHLIALHIKDTTLECEDGKERPSCFYGGSLEDFIKK